MTIEELLHSPDAPRLARLEQFDAVALETVCAFANTAGGTVLLPLPGAAGTDPEAQEGAVQQWLQQITSALQPLVSPAWEIFRSGAQAYALLHVPEAVTKPVAFEGRCYHRQGASNHLLPAAEITRLHLQSTGKSWDALPHETATLADIAPAALSGFQQRWDPKRMPSAHEQPGANATLEQLGLMRHEKISNAGVLLFTRDPQRFYPHARIKAGRFKSETLIIDDQEITGGLFEQVEAAFAFIKKHLTVRLVITGQPQREEVWDYPLAAVREALINAVCHRDYTVPAEIQIRLYDDQLIFWNPGNLPPDLRIDDLKRRHRSVLRNKLIGAMFYEAGLIEKWGSGTNRIIEECKKAGLPEPEWREHQGLMLILKQDAFTEDFLMEQGLNERQMKAVAHVKKRRRITNQEYQQLVEVKKRTASEDLRQLEEKNIFERVGSTGKGTYYKLRGR